MVFAALRSLKITASGTAEKPPGKLHHRQKSFTRLRNRRFFVETLRRRATFRVSGGKWQRFSFFLGATKTKKQLLTKNFAYAQYDALKYRHSEPVGRTLRVSSYVRLTPASEARISPATVVVGAKPKAPCRKRLSPHQSGNSELSAVKTPPAAEAGIFRRTRCGGKAQNPEKSAKKMEPKFLVE